MQLHEAAVTSAVWDFVLFALDILCGPSWLVKDFNQDHPRRVASISSVPVSIAQRRIEKLLTYSIWPSTAEEIYRGCRLSVYTIPLNPYNSVYR